MPKQRAAFGVEAGAVSESRERANSSENEQFLPLYPGDVGRHPSPGHAAPELSCKVTPTPRWFCCSRAAPVSSQLAARQTSTALPALASAALHLIKPRDNLITIHQYFYRLFRQAIHCSRQSKSIYSIRNRGVRLGRASATLPCNKYKLLPWKAERGRKSSSNFFYE